VENPFLACLAALVVRYTLLPPRASVIKVPIFLQSYTVISFYGPGFPILLRDFVYSPAFESTPAAPAAKANLPSLGIYFVTVRIILVPLPKASPTIGIAPKRLNPVFAAKLPRAAPVLTPSFKSA
jgi:hypothetical protein